MSWIFIVHINQNNTTGVSIGAGTVSLQNHNHDKTALVQHKITIREISANYNINEIPFG
jgi:hypothetical protein